MAASKSILFFFFLTCLFHYSAHSSISSTDQSMSCNTFTFPGNKHYYSTCNDLPVLNSFLHWNYNPSSRTFQMAFRRTQIGSTSWVAWAINPTSRGMVGSQAIITYRKSDGTVVAYTSPINSYRTLMQEGNLSLPVYDVSATHRNNEVTIFATFVLPENTTTINHVWQDGPMNGDVFGIHSVSGDHVRSMGTLNLTSGTTKIAKGTTSKTTLRNIHGLLNAVGWGFLMPIGVLVARYLKAFKSEDPLWFKIHVGMQCTGFLFGLAGMATGFALGFTARPAGHVHHTNHLAIGITIVVLGLLQVLARWLRPSVGHKYRYIWNIYHHYVGYSVLILSIANIIIGLNILKPPKQWKIAYYYILGVFVITTLVLEILKRYKSYAKVDNKSSKDEINIEISSACDTVSV